TIVVEKHIKNTVCASMAIVPMLRVGIKFVTLCVTWRFCYVSDVWLCQGHSES
ncbi:hypothetical protein PSYMP_15129, partial [Pseudomonas amygdali pv. morsprunorum str. M302280]